MRRCGSSSRFWSFLAEDRHLQKDGVIPPLKYLVSTEMSLQGDRQAARHRILEPHASSTILMSVQNTGANSELGVRAPPVRASRPEMESPGVHCWQGRGIHFLDGRYTILRLPHRSLRAGARASPEGQGRQVRTVPLWTKRSRKGERRNTWYLLVPSAAPDRAINALASIYRAGISDQPILPPD